jgi:ketosteroid isomerase-like protein
MKLNFLLLLLFLSSSVMAQEPDSSSAIFNMREAEQHFAQASVMIGRNAAFAEYFADSSAIFTDKWLTNGKQFSKELKASPVVLKWEPEFMDISASRDFGISTGPWEAQEYRPNTAPVATGYYLTVWKKQSDGEWKVILDGGSTTPAISVSKHNFSFPSGADKPVSNPPEINVELSCKELLNSEKLFLSYWEKSPSSSACTSFLIPDARIQLNGHLPTTNLDTINILIAKLDKKLTWESIGAGAASSGDLGFTYGLLQISSTPGVTKGHYVRIWKKQPGSDWRIVIEMMNVN